MIAYAIDDPHSSHGGDVFDAGGTSGAILCVVESTIFVCTIGVVVESVVDA